MHKKEFYRYTTILFLIKQQSIPINADIKCYVKEAIQISDMTDEDIFVEVANYYDFFS